MPLNWDASEIFAANELLATAGPQEVLRFAVKQFHPHLLMATAFGAEGCAIIAMLSEIEPTTQFINLETGYQFPETLAVREQLQAKYGVKIDWIEPTTTVAEYEAIHDGPLYSHRPDQCCHDRKVLPLRAAMKAYAPKAWISAIRKDQTVNRANAQVVEWDAKFQIVKINPLLHWTKKEVWGYIVKQGVPYNPLHDQGFPSIGCWPCTRAVAPGDDDRSGRWAGQAKTECGLHVLDEKEGSGI